MKGVPAWGIRCCRGGRVGCSPRGGNGDDHAWVNFNGRSRVGHVLDDMFGKRGFVLRKSFLD